MADLQHDALTGASLHEPKGVASATADQTYIADGAGSGAWTNTDKHVHIQAEIADISTAASSWTVSPVAGDIVKVYSVIDGAIITVDAGLSFELGGTPITGGDITVDFATSAAGTVDSSTPSANNTVAAGGAIEVITDGASTNAVKAVIVFVIEV